VYGTSIKALYKSASFTFFYLYYYYYYYYYYKSNKYCQCYSCCGYKYNLVLPADDDLRSSGRRQGLDSGRLRVG